MTYQQRAAFEAWYASKFVLDSYLRFTFDESCNQYEAPFLDYMWSAYQAALASPEVQALWDALIESDNQLKQFLPLVDSGIIHADDDFHWCLTRNRAALAAMEKNK